MPLSKKIEWIIHYYGIWIAVGVIVVFVIFSFMKTVLFPEPISDTNIIILSDDFDRGDVADIENEISTLTEGSVSITIYNVSEMYGRSAFSIKLNSDQIDLVISPKEEADQMRESGYLSACEKMSYGDLYLGIPVNARKGDKLDVAIDYFMKGVKK